VLAKLVEGQNVAISRKKGRWFNVIYADPVTTQRAEGWIYASSLELFD
jgi:hypothetical protein